MDRFEKYLSGRGAPFKVTGLLTVIIGVLLIADVYTSWDDHTSRLILAVLAVAAFIFAAIQLAAGHVIEQPGFQEKYEQAIQNRQRSKGM